MGTSPGLREEFLKTHEEWKNKELTKKDSENINNE